MIWDDNSSWDALVWVKGLLDLYADVKDKSACMLSEPFHKEFRELEVVMDNAKNSQTE